MRAGLILPGLFDRPSVLGRRGNQGPIIQTVQGSLMDSWAKIYQYELTFADGRVVRQADEDIKMVDFVRKYGRMVKITLVPQRSDMKPLCAAIPQGTHPVYRRRILRRNGTQLERLRFLIGWSSGNARNLIAVDAATGAVELLLPEAVK